MGRGRAAVTAALQRRARVIRVSADMETVLRDLLAAWEAYPPDEQVADCINDDSLWDEVRRILAEIDNNGRR